MLEAANRGATAIAVHRRISESAEPEPTDRFSGQVTSGQQSVQASPYISILVSYRLPLASYLLPLAGRLGKRVGTDLCFHLRARTRRGAVAAGIALGRWRGCLTSHFSRLTSHRRELGEVEPDNRQLPDGVELSGSFSCTATEGVARLSHLSLLPSYVSPKGVAKEITAKNPATPHLPKFDPMSVACESGANRHHCLSTPRPLLERSCNFWTTCPRNTRLRRR